MKMATTTVSFYVLTDQKATGTVSFLVLIDQKATVVRPEF